VVARFTESGTHQGEFMGIAPTGRRMSVTEIGILRLVDGKVVESWYEVDMLGLMQQLGVFPPPESSTAINNIEQEKIMANEIIEQNRRIGQNFFNFLMRGGDPNEVFTSDFVYHDAQGVSHDLAGTMALIQPILVAIPDRAVEVEEEIITNDRVVLRWRRSGSFQNDAWGVRATGNRFNDVGVTVLGIGENNRISQVWEYVDFLNFFTQIGAIRELVANMGSGQSTS
jgi:predicted ester cyclase